VVTCGAVACGESASLASAVREAAMKGVERSLIGTAVFPMPAEPKPAGRATTQAARTSVPHNAVTVANRRGFVISSPPKDSTGLIVQAKRRTRNAGNGRSSIFPRSVAPMQRAADKQLLFIFVQL
jgi:hypothetical protein